MNNNTVIRITFFLGVATGIVLGVALMVVGAV